MRKNPKYEPPCNDTWLYVTFLFILIICLAGAFFGAVEPGEYL